MLLYNGIGSYAISSFCNKWTYAEQCYDMKVIVAEFVDVTEPQILCATMLMKVIVAEHIDTIELQIL